MSEKKYCIDCQIRNETVVYNDEVDPPLLLCKECGQFVYDKDDPAKSGKYRIRKFRHDITKPLID